MCRHAEPQKLSPRMSQQQPKRDRWDDEHVYRRDAVGMIAKERLPALRRGSPSLYHVFCHGRLAEIDPQLEQFAGLVVEFTISLGFRSGCGLL
jgi:hypothetical protein